MSLGAAGDQQLQRVGEEVRGPNLYNEQPDSSDNTFGETVSALWQALAGRTCEIEEPIYCIKDELMQMCLFH